MSKKLWIRKSLPAVEIVVWPVERLEGASLPVTVFPPPTDVGEIEGGDHAIERAQLGVAGAADGVGRDRRRQSKGRKRSPGPGRRDDTGDFTR